MNWLIGERFVVVNFFFFEEIGFIAEVADQVGWI
jgi:hypothetical protein